MVDEHEDVREKIRLAIEEGKRAMAESEQMMVDLTKLRDRKGEPTSEQQGLRMQVLQSCET